MHIYIYVCVCVCVCVCVPGGVNLYIYIYICIYIYTYIHTCIHAYIHTYIPGGVNVYFKVVHVGVDDLVRATGVELCGKTLKSQHPSIFSLQSHGILTFQKGRRSREHLL
jgi:hypothetical protein